MKKYRLTGLIAAVHTPMREDGSLFPERIDRQNDFLQRDGVQGVFVAGTTGEALSLTVDERKSLTDRWIGAARGTGMKVIVHVGHNCLPAAREMAAYAEKKGADGIAAMAPFYFKPASVTDLADFFASIAAAAPSLPFYYYDIPALTGVNLSARELLVQGAGRIPTLAGVKYTNPDMAQLKECIDLHDGAFDILFGCDEALLAGLALGARGAVGSSYNFAAPLYHRIIDAFDRGEMEAARAEQQRSIRMITTLARHGYLAAAKATMALIGVDCGPVRLPLKPPGAERIAALEKELEEIGFFEWSR